MIISPRLRFDIITENDVADVFATMNSHSVADTITFLTWPMTLQQAQRWCQKSVGPANTLFIVHHQIDNTAIGCISLHAKSDSIMEVGYWINEEFQGRGYASEMLQCICHYAAADLQIEKLMATVAIDNGSSLKVLQKQGFKIIGADTVMTAKNTVMSRHVMELNL